MHFWLTVSRASEKHGVLALKLAINESIDSGQSTIVIWLLWTTHWMPWPD